MSRFDGLDPWAILKNLGVGGIASLAPVEGGADTAVWRVAHGGATSALRVFRAEQAGPARREAIALAAAGEAGIPGPAVRAAGTWQGRPVLLLSWCAGRPLVEIILSQPSRLRPLAFDFGRMQARIHAVPAPAALGFAPGALLHGDYHPMNALADETGVTATLDWVNVGSGDPRADLAQTVLLLRLSDPPPGVPLPQFRALRRAFEAG